MTAIFISHRSSDNIEAQALKDWLREQGHEQLFLDFDPADGIPAGVEWEERLYRELRRCQALLIVLSPAWLESTWCSNELAIAREKGKAVFVVRVRSCPAGRVIPAIQEVDLTTDRVSGLARLARGLRDHGLDPRDAFDWKPDRPIYPGLAPYDIDDAAIFFGRSEESWHVVEELRRLRLQGAGAAKLLLITGASGSGKSSLMRAGVLARLRKEPANWIVARPFRTVVDAIGGLADALAWAFPPGQRSTNVGALTAQLTGGEGPGKLIAIAKELRFVLERPEATLVLAVDQAEELLAAERGSDAEMLLELFRKALALVGNEIVAVATIRSDRLGAWQQHTSIKATAEHSELPFEVRPLGPMPMSQIGEIVRGPAAYEGLGVDENLVDAIRSDIAAPDALPLLAYTLQYLYRKFPRDKRLTLANYRSFGGLEGSVRGQADAAIPIHRMDDAERRALQVAFVPGLVRASADGGFIRHRLPLATLPPLAEPYLRRLIDEARLLTTSGDSRGGLTLEVAHESLLRVWPTLVRWIADDAQSLKQLETMQRAARDWALAGRSDDFLVHRDRRLLDVENLISLPHFASALEDIDRNYLANCRKIQEAREGEILAARSRELAQLRTAQVAQSRFLVERAEQALGAHDPVHAAQLGLASLPDLATGVDRPVVHEAERVTWDACQNIRERFTLSREHQKFQTAMFSGDCALVLTVTEGGLASLWNARAGLLIYEIGIRGDRVTSAIFAPNDSSILVVHEGRMCLQATNSLKVKYTCQLDGHVNTAAFSPDGARLVTSTGFSALDFEGDKKSVDLWDGQHGTRIATLEGHNGVVWTAAFSSDSRHLATASFDKTVRLWDGRTGAALAVLRGHSDQVRAIAFSPDGHLLASGADDKTVRLWNVATGECLAILGGPQNLVRGVTFSPDGRRIVAIGGHPFTNFGSKKTHVWDVTTSKEADGIETPGAANWVEFSQDGLRFVTVTNLSQIQLWNATSCRAVAELKGHTDSVYAARFSTDGKQLVTASADGSARIWDVYCGVHRTVLPGHKTQVRGAVISPASDRVLTVSYDSAWLWNLLDGCKIALLGRKTEDVTHAKPMSSLVRFLLRLFVRHNKVERFLRSKLIDLPIHAEIGSAEFSPDGSHVVTASAGGNFEADAWIWNASSGTKRVCLHGHTGYILRAVFSPDSALVATASLDGTAKLWDVRTGGLKSTLDDHGGPVLLSIFSPDSNFVVTSSLDKIVRVWHVTSGIQVGKLTGHVGIVFKLVFSPDGTRIVTISDDHTARLWDGRTGEELANLSERPGRPWLPNYFMFSCAFAFSNDSALLAVGDSANPIARVYCAQSGRRLSELRGHAKETAGLDACIESVHFSPDDLLVITTSDDKTARIWNAKTGAPLKILDGHQAKVTDAVFSGDGAHVVTTSEDRTVRLWKVATGEQVLVFTGHEDKVSSVSLANDGSYFMTESGDGTSRIWVPRWEWHTKDLVETTKARLPRCMTQEERRRAYLDMYS